MNDHWLVVVRLRVPPQVLVQHLQHLTLVQTLLLHVRSELSGVTLHQVHDLIVHVHVDHLPLINVRGRVPLVDVGRHAPLSGSELHQQIPLLKGRVAKANQGALSNPLPVLGLQVCVAQSSQLGPLLLLHAEQLLPVQSSQILSVLGHRGPRLPLLIQHLVRDVHVRHAAVASASGLLTDGLLLHSNRVHPLLALICLLLVASKL